MRLLTVGESDSLGALIRSSAGVASVAFVTDAIALLRSVEGVIEAGCSTGRRSSTLAFGCGRWSSRAVNFFLRLIEGSMKVVCFVSELYQ